MEWIKIVLIILMLAVLGSLAVGMRKMTSTSQEQQKRLVVALTWRICLSFLIFILIILLSYFEVIQPHSL